MTRVTDEPPREKNNKWPDFSLIWAATWQSQQNDLCTQWRLRSAWAFAQSDQSLLSAWRNIGPLITYWAHNEDWSDWVDAQTDLSLRWALRSFCCHTCFSMGDLGVQVSVRLFVRPSVNIYHGCLVSATPLSFCRTCFSIADVGVQVSVRLFVRPYVHPSTFTMGVLWAQLLLQFFSSPEPKAHKVSL